MDFRQLYYFLSVCEHNCIAQAAQSLFISPQALSKAISQLEKEFQMSLFSRTPQGLILTEAGEQLRTLGLPILESVTALQGEMASLYQRSQGVLLLGITSTLDFFLGATAFEKFQSTHSPYKIVVNEHSHTDCEDSVASGAMFAALTYGSSDKPSVKTIPLMKRQRVCLVPKDSPLAKKSLIRISDLRGYPSFSSMASTPFRATPLYFSLHAASADIAVASVTVSSKSTQVQVSISRREAFSSSLISTLLSSR